MALTVRNPGHDQRDIHWQRSTGCGELREPRLGPSQPAAGQAGAPRPEPADTEGVRPRAQGMLTEALVEPELQAQDLRSGLGGWLCEAGLRGGGRVGGEGGRGSWGSRGWGGWGWKESPGLRWFLEVSHICSRGAGAQRARGVLKSHTHRGSARLPVFSGLAPCLRRCMRLCC